jgi:TldD protein
VLPSDEVLAAVIERLCSTGAEFAEVFFQDSFRTCMVREGGLPTGTERFSECGAGLRVEAGETSTYGHVDGLQPDLLLEEAGRLAESLGSGAPRKPESLQILPRRNLITVQTPPREVGMERKESFLEEVEREAHGCDGRVCGTSTVYRDATTEVAVANSEGVLVRESRHFVTLYQQVRVQENGRVRTGAEIASGAAGFEFFDGNRHLALARAAARTTLHLLAAGRAPSGTMPVVLSPAAAGLFVHEAVGHALEGDYAAAGHSPFSGRVGDRVAPQGVHLVDDGSAPGRRGTTDYDDEGEPTRKVLLIEDGILRGFLTDRASAIRLGAERTGHGRRESYGVPPKCRMRNTLLMPGETPPDELIASVDFGLYVSRMGGGEVAIPAGDFTFQVTEGYIIRDGRISEPVSGAGISGNGPQILATLKGLATDMDYGVGTCAKEGQVVPVSDGAPTLLLGSLSVGGGPP